MRSRWTALCGVSAALGTALLLLGGLIPGATYCAPLLGMLPLIPCMEEYGRGAALSVYAVTAALAVLLVPDKELACVYLFFGYYPALRPAITVCFFPSAPMALARSRRTAARSKWSASASRVISSVISRTSWRDRPSRSCSACSMRAR